jgi:hypothetical protein
VTISIVYLSSVTLLEPFARSQVQDRGGEKHKRCDSKNGVVHGGRIGCACLGSAQKGIRKLLAARKARSKEAMT